MPLTPLDQQLPRFVGRLKLRIHEFSVGGEDDQESMGKYHEEYDRGERPGRSIRRSSLDYIRQEPDYPLAI
jgi:hypothetical protein